MKLNEQLEKQLDKLLPADLWRREDLRKFISAVNETYNMHERERTASNAPLSKPGISSAPQVIQQETLGIETEKKLTEQKMFYERILNEIPADVAILDKHQTYLFVNPSAIKDPETRVWMIGKTDAEYSIYKSRPLAATHERTQHFEDVVNTGRKKEWEERIVTEKGQVEHYLRGLSPVFNERGELDMMIVYGTNITARKKTEEQIRLSEIKYRSIFNNSLALICTHDLRGRILDMNSAAITMLGYDISELKGSFLQNLIPVAKRAEFNTSYLNEIQTKGKATGIMIAMSKAGKRTYLLYQNYLVTEDTHEPYVIGISQDITQRIEAEKALKNSEEKYRSIIANMNLGLLEVDEGENIIYANNSFCEMSGYEPGELLGKSAIDLLLPGDNIESGKQMAELRQQGLSDAYELRVRNKRGDLKWWLISGAPTYNNNGQVKGSVGIHLDITLQKTLEEDLRRAKAEAEHSSKAKEIFLANMSHEIRTPMNAILGIGSLLAKTSLHPQQRAYLHNIQTAANNLLVIINDLLDFSKIESGKMTLENIGFHLNDVVANAVQILRHKAEEKGLLITFERNPAVAPVLLGDPYRINQVLMNLLSNSVKFTETGQVHITVSVTSSTPGNQQIEFTVADTGIGMSSDFIAHLFDKFSQEDVSVTRKYGGTGLGMSIIKQLVELMGGELHVSSEKNRGTAISFMLQLSIGTPADVPQTKNGHIDTQILKGKTILLAEDNELNRLLAIAILTDHGAIVKEAENGAIAIDELKAAVFDLVLMDVQMPVKDGLDTTRYIRSHISANIPIIAMTANAMKKQEEQCIEAGMNDFLSKPFNEQGLLQMVGKWLGRDTAAITDTSMHNAGTAPLFDLSKLRSISRGSEEFVSNMIRLFIEKTPPVLEQVDEAWVRRDMKALAELAHRLKTSVNIMGIPSLDGTLEQLENMPDKKLDDAAVHAHVTHLRTTIFSVIKALLQM